MRNVKTTKLRLDRDTIRALTTSQLSDAHGGVSGDPCDVTIAHSKCDLAGCSGGDTCFATTA